VKTIGGLQFSNPKPSKNKHSYLTPKEGSISQNLHGKTANNLLEKNSETQPQKTFKQTSGTITSAGGLINEGDNRKIPRATQRRRMAHARGNTTKSKDGQKPNPANNRIPEGIQFHSDG
jgi:hypothetical protein